MKKDNIGCAILAVALFSIMGVIYYTSGKKEEARREEKKQKEAAYTGWDEYVIIDRMGCAHSEDCFQLSYNDSVMYAVRYIDTLSVTKDDYKYVCIECVDMRQYKNLERISERNRNGVKPKKKIPGWD